MDIDYNHAISGAGVSPTNMKQDDKEKEPKDKAGNTYKDKATADEFDSQNDAMSGGIMDKVMGMFGG